MTVLTGYLQESPNYGIINPSISANLGTFAGTEWWPPSYVEYPELMWQVETPNYPVSTTPRASPGWIVPYYLYDYYFRIHMTPPNIVLGNLVSDKQVQLLVWNAFFIPKTITALTTPLSDGVTIELPVGSTIPLTLAPLRERTFLVDAAGKGTSHINAPIVFTVGGININVPVTGERVILFAYPPDWATPYDETFVYNSWVLPSGDGGEQTGSNWGNQPRRSIDFTIHVKHTETQRLENMLFGWQDNLFAVPHWSDRARLNSAVAIGTSVLAFDTRYMAYEVGSHGVLYKNETSYEVFEVATLTDTSITTAAPIGADWPARSLVYPMLTGFINAHLSGTYYTDNVMALPVSFDCAPTDPTNTSIGGATPTYRGEELYLGPVNWISGLNYTQDSDRVILDYNVGTVRPYSRNGFSKKTRKHQWTIRKHSEASAYRAWLGRREGIARPVFMPSGTIDFKLVLPVSYTSPSLIVDANDYNRFSLGALARRDLIILLRNGSYIARRITNAEPQAGDRLRLTLDSAVGVDITPAQIKRISFLSFYRLSSNSNTIRWLTDLVGTVESDLIIKTVA